MHALLRQRAGMTMVTEFFLPVLPPTSTHQEKQVHVVNGKPVFYEPAEVKAARQKLRAHLGRHVPAEVFIGQQAGHGQPCEAA